jgi:hypothetical protein
VKSLIDDFRQRRAHLSTLRSGDEKGRLLDFLTWLEAQAEINPVLVELRNRIDLSKLISARKFRPEASSQEEIAAVGLYMMDQIKAGSSLWELAIKLYISPPYRTNKTQDYSDEVMTCYINPLLDRVEAGLNELGGLVTVENAAELRFKLFNDATFRSVFPNTADALKKIAEYCGRPEDSGSWFHVAVSCREALGVFVRELQVQKKLTPPPELKQGDIKGMLKQVAKERSDTSDALISLIQAVWVYVQSNVHRPAASKQEALRAYLWTGLLISEMKSFTKPA